MGRQSLPYAVHVTPPQHFLEINCLADDWFVIE